MGLQHLSDVQTLTPNVWSRSLGKQSTFSPRSLSVPLGINERNALNFDLKEANCRFAEGPGVNMLTSRATELRGKNSNFPGLAVFNKGHADFSL